MTDVTEDASTVADPDQPIVHTPGPWRVEARMSMPGEITDVLIYADGHAPLIGCATSEEVSLETAEANARLMAAAPDLLEALKAMIVMMDRGGQPKKLDDALTWRQNDELARQMADDAVAKATGVV